MRSIAPLILLAFVVALAHADECTSSNCDIADDCRCAASESPIDVAETPQFVVISVDDAVQTAYFDQYYKPLLGGRKNADGSPISATFYVPHQYTNYSTVNELYNMGMEIGSNSISKNYSMDYWLKATVDDLIDEFGGQKTILKTFANVPDAGVVGVRIPNMLMNGDVTIEAIARSGFAYDNSWPTLSDDRLWPYTLDYVSTQSCLVSKCPQESHAGFWELPINDLRNMDLRNCNNLIGCQIDGTAAEIKGWLQREFDAARANARAPFNLLINAAWFQMVENSFEALAEFLDELNATDDVFVVSNRQVLDWIKDPQPLGEYRPQANGDRRSCDYNYCKLPFGKGTMYMGSCTTCPTTYPWLGNPLGDD